MGYWATHMFIRTTNTAALEQAVNNPVGADYQQALITVLSLFVAVQPER